MGALMGTFGGLQTFGLRGIFIGPMIIALGNAILDEWLAYSGPVATDQGMVAHSERANGMREVRRAG